MSCNLSVRVLMSERDPPHRPAPRSAAPRRCPSRYRSSRPGRSSRCRPRRSRASSCACAATRTPSTGTCAWTPRCARSSSARTTSFRPRPAASCWTIPARSWPGAPAPRLTYIAAFGSGVETVVGRRIPSDRGFAGRVYTTGRPAQTDHLEQDDPLLGLAPDTGPVRSRGRRADRRRRVDLRRAAAREPALGRIVHAARQGAAPDLRRVHVVVDPERARRDPGARPGAHRRSDRAREQPLLPHPPRRRDRARRPRADEPFVAVHRPRPVQGGQRSLRPPDGKLDAAEGRQAARRQRARRGAGRALRRRRVRHHPPGRRPRSRWRRRPKRCA